MAMNYHWRRKLCNFRATLHRWSAKHNTTPNSVNYRGVYIYFLQHLSWRGKKKVSIELTESIGETLRLTFFFDLDRTKRESQKLYTENFTGANRHLTIVLFRCEVRCVSRLCCWNWKYETTPTFGFLIPLPHFLIACNSVPSLDTWKWYSWLMSFDSTVTVPLAPLDWTEAVPSDGPENSEVVVWLDLTIPFYFILLLWMDQHVFCFLITHMENP